MPQKPKATRLIHQKPEGRNHLAEACAAANAIQSADASRGTTESDGMGHSNAAGEHRQDEEDDIPQVDTAVPEQLIRTRY